MQKIKVQIAGRQYPMTVSEEEEFFVRRASKNLDLLIRSLESKYFISDKQDSLAMVSLEFATKYEIQKKNFDEILVFANQKIETLNSILNINLGVL